MTPPAPKPLRRPRGARFIPPPEFDPTAYPRPNDAAAWYAALKARYDARVIIELRLDHPGAHALVSADLWATYRDMIASPATPDRRPPIEELTPTSLASDACSIAEVEMKGLGYRALLIDPDCGDEELKAAFSAKLAEWRKDSPLPTKRRGSASTNVTLTKEHFARWHRERILALFDLKIWALLHGARISHSIAGRILFPDRPDDADSKQLGRQAQAALDEATRCLEMLAYAAGVAKMDA